jgi:tRNA threonylcarbamoyl adenosine modification protein YjeE
MIYSTYEIPDEASMERFGRALAQVLPSKLVVALNGTLGAGKTFLVRAIARAWKIPSEEIGSPTFVLCREYYGDRHAFHLDAYRLTDESELLDLGFEEWLATDAVIFLEWAEKVCGCLPQQHLEIAIETTSIDSRIVTLTEFGEPCGVIEKLNWPG